MGQTGQMGKAGQAGRDGTVGQLIAFERKNNLKLRYMKTTIDIGKHKPLKKFKTPERESEIISLTLKEFLTLYNHTFKSKQLDQARDVFAFSCSTGLKLSDLISLKQSDIQGDFAHTQRTGENSIVPLNKYSKEILMKYKGTVHEPMPKIPNQKLNHDIKECCKEVGIKNYDLITSHAARKTFPTLMLLMDAPERVIRNINDHKNN